MLTITHTPEAGTIIEGTSRGDGTAEILKANGWRWGRSIGAWYVPQSRDRLPKWWTINRAATALRDAGHEVTIDADETFRPTAEVEADKTERQAARVDALDAKADRRAADADTADAAARRALDRLPEGGEPIKIGHHSENRHRNAIAKADAAMGRSVEADREATRARARADVAAGTTESRYAPGMVARRIDRLDTDIRGCTRRIEGSSHNFGGGYIETTAPATGAYRERLLTQRAQLEDQRDYWSAVREAQAAAGQVTIHSRDTINKGDMIKHRFGWHVVTRVNPKSVTVALDWNDGTRPYKVVYADVQGHHTAAEVEAARAAATEKAATETAAAS
ncbi:hypothetical protein C5D04_10330 [Rathayibacter sp. AY1D2]|jgi:hypothetical protein|uniref:DUF3560 domain-containing protein n=1 Tax=unclassified Rathayibacter TaxID=2609250 RepID=UPI000CE92E56|nr:MULTISPECIES: DUF3560 domain-containing protein [unclassified Rathayibacter]PPF32443.1 hypothetical protein C5B93_15410 [Rathayibacter sp. AY1A2]PPI13202.1 hypothetical protein C5D04_10330 [Rathayibacter sp. AY1D2]